MKKVKSLLTLAVLFFVAAGVLATGYFIKSPTNVTQHAEAATNLSVFPVRQTLGPGQNLTFSINMDTGDNKTTGIDMVINFDPQVMQIGSIQRGSGIVPLNNTLRQNFDNIAGTISFATFTLDKTQAVSGTALEVLNVTARVTNSASLGNSLISFDPSTAIAATGETQNVLAGGIPGTITIANITPSPTPVATDTPTPAPGQPNSCGGTCGSNVNCAANLYCYAGYCRNPSCARSADCTCITPTPAPTQAPTIAPVTTSPTQKPTATVTATPTPLVVVMTPTPNNFWQTIFNSQTPIPIPSPTLAPAASTVPDMAKSFDLLPWIIGSLVVAGLAIILIVVGIIKESGMHRAKPPVIKV